jgi:hypothetical protein
MTLILIAILTGATVIGQAYFFVTIVDRVFPLAEAREAHEHLERGNQLGKVVLTIPA